MVETKFAFFTKVSQNTGKEFLSGFLKVYGRTLMLSMFDNKYYNEDPDWNPKFSVLVKEVENRYEPEYYI